MTTSKVKLLGHNGGDRGGQWHSSKNGGCLETNLQLDWASWPGHWKAQEAENKSVYLEGFELECNVS